MRDAAVPIDPLCRTLLGEQKLDESAMNIEDRTSLTPRMRCFSTGKFAWALRADRLEAGSSVRLTLLFASSDGARAQQVSTLTGIEWPPLLGRHAAMYDYDGDGTPEFAVTISKDVRTFVPAARLFVTVKKGAIVPYPTGSSYVVDGLMDMDRDGRPDLRVSFDVGKRTVCSPIDEGRVEVELGAHSLPGGKFSLDDSVAKNFSERRCDDPLHGGLFVPSLGPSGERQDLSLEYIACTRLHGKSVDAMVSEIQAACASHADETKKCTGPCRHLPDALAVARFKMPLQLDADAGTIKR
jgi:hypothetical protein